MPVDLELDHEARLAAITAQAEPAVTAPGADRMNTTRWRVASGQPSAAAATRAAATAVTAVDDGYPSAPWPRDKAHYDLALDWLRHQPEPTRAGLRDRTGWSYDGPVKYLWNKHQQTEADAGAASRPADEGTGAGPAGHATVPDLPSGALASADDAQAAQAAPARQEEQLQAA